MTTAALSPQTKLPIEVVTIASMLRRDQERVEDLAVAEAISRRSYRGETAQSKIKPVHFIWDL